MTPQVDRGGRIATDQRELMAALRTQAQARGAADGRVAAVAATGDRRPTHELVGPYEHARAALAHARPHSVTVAETLRLRIARHDETAEAAAAQIPDPAEDHQLKVTAAA